MFWPMTKDKLLKYLEEYMLENSIGYVEIVASTNITRTKIKPNFYEEKEDDIEENGYQSKFTC